MTKKIKNIFFGTIGAFSFLMATYFSMGFITEVLFPIWSPPKKIAYPNIISVKSNNCRFLIPVTINGRKAQFLFDPSKTHSMVDSRFGKLIPSTFSFGEWFGISFVKKIEIGDMSFKEIRLPTGKIDGLKKEKVDGILGVDFLVHVRATLDFQNKKILFDIPESGLTYQRSGFVKLHYSFRNIMPEIDITFAGQAYRSLIDFSKNPDFMNLYTDIIEPSKKNLGFVILGNNKIEGAVKIASKSDRGTFQDSLTSLGCKLFSQFKKVTIDFKQKRFSYKF
ncbi:MAG: hypothetical protein HN576_08905 [Bacteriovoracaceae bacterium]|jgi:hypothetical protein|nr:hypothetical protein [Bacteriovoracaceae bacterium]